MLIKSLCLGAVLVSTPLCLMTPQGEQHDRSAPSATQQDPRPSETLSPRQRAELRKVRHELDGARHDLVEMRSQLEEVLDALDATFVTPQHRNCSPRRNRGLMSHYQWLEKNNHAERAEKALATIVEQAGNRVSNLNSMAWSLMTDDSSAGKFDRVALALVERMEAKGSLRHQYLDTVALARFLNGQGERAVALQKKAIAAGGNSDDYRRRLRTYEAALNAVMVARQQAPKAMTPSNVMPVRTTAGTIVATNQEDE